MQVNFEGKYMAIEYANEILKKIDDAEGGTKVQLLKKYGAMTPWNLLLSLNFHDQIKVNVPDGMPPYKRDESINPDFFKTTLGREIRRVGAILVGRSEHIAKLQREAIFIQILEGVPPGEADVLCFAKDKALEEMYPTITYDLVASVFPDYCHKTETK